MVSHQWNMDRVWYFRMSKFVGNWDSRATSRCLRGKVYFYIYYILFFSFYSIQRLRRGVLRSKLEKQKNWKSKQPLFSLSSFFISSISFLTVIYISFSLFPLPNFFFLNRTEEKYWKRNSQFVSPLALISVEWRVSEVFLLVWGGVEWWWSWSRRKELCTALLFGRHLRLFCWVHLWFLQVI